MNDELLHFNGVREDGEYGLPPMSDADLSSFIQGESDASYLHELQVRARKMREAHERGLAEGIEDDCALKEGLDPKKLDEAGWGVIFAHDADPAVREALDELVDRRREQAGERFRVYDGGDGFRAGKDRKNTFLARHGAAPGPVDPERVPYYLLIVGSPEKIPFRFQTQLDLQYGVGRIDFGNDLDAYARYASSVVAAEKREARRPRRVHLFSVVNDSDVATRQSSERLVEPLREHLAQRDGLDVAASVRDAAHKTDLHRLLGGDGGAVPSLLFTASHGMEFAADARCQEERQGAIVCQDWPGPGSGKVQRDHYYMAEDLSPKADLSGLVAFFFACFAGGTPQYDEFFRMTGKKRQAIARRPFVAALPKRMLSNAGGGALAVVAHVERAWGCSFMWRGVRSQPTVFESVLDRLLDGHPIGSAFEYFNMRHAELSAILADSLEDFDCGLDVDPRELAQDWTANNDARGYTVLGDPAVRLPASSGDG